jgi:hypothetical protein
MSETGPSCLSSSPCWGPIKSGGSDDATGAGIFQTAGPMPRDRKSDTADVTPSHRGSRGWNAALTAINMSPWNISAGTGSDVWRIILVIGIRVGTLGPKYDFPNGLARAKRATATQTPH